MRGAVITGMSVLGLALGFATALAGTATVPQPHRFDGPSLATELDLADLVPPAGRLDHVWYVPPGRGVPRVVVGWHFEARRSIPAWPDPRRYVLTAWTAEQRTPGSSRWDPHTLVNASPFPFSSRSVRLADVTADGTDDFLVTIVCSECNHATAVASVYASAGGEAVRKIYGGDDVLDVAKGSGPDAAVRGRLISETAWGARDGLLWFDEPRGGSSVCCPAFRLQTFLRWSGHGWRIVSRRRVSPAADSLVERGFPLP